MWKYILVILVTANTAWASVGEITAATGPGTIKRENDRFDGAVGTDLEMQDAITTQNGAWQLQFVDDTRVDVTEHSRMVIDEFIYDPASGTGALNMRATLGAVRYASGQIAKNSRQRVNIGTPTATISVRGTDFFMIVDEIGGSMITLLPSCDTSGACVTGEISVESDAGQVIMNQAFQTTIVPSRMSVPAKPIILELPVDQLRAMLIVRNKQPYDEELERQYPVTNLLDIDFLKFDELDRDPLVEGIKNMWVTDLDNANYLQSAFYDAMERAMKEIMAQWLDELGVQNEELFAQKFLGLDPETNIYYDQDPPTNIVQRREGDDHFFRLRLHEDYGYTINMVQEGFNAYGYRVGVGGGNVINITQGN
jgi:hypothetical protein